MEPCNAYGEKYHVLAPQAVWRNVSQPSTAALAQPVEATIQVPAPAPLPLISLLCIDQAMEDVQAPPEQLTICYTHTAYASADTLRQAKALDSARPALDLPETRRTSRIQTSDLTHSKHSGSLVLLRLHAFVALPVAGIVFVAPIPKRPLLVEDAALCTDTQTFSLNSCASAVNGAAGNSL